MNNRGQLGGNVQKIIFAIIITGILLGMGFLIFGEMLNSGVLNSELQTVTNDSTGFINQSGFTLPGGPGANTFAVTAARTSGGVVIPAANFTVDGTTGVISNATSTEYSAAQIDYTFLGGEDAYVNLNNTITALDTVPSWLPLVVLISMIVIILGLVFTIPGSRQGA